MTLIVKIIVTNPYFERFVCENLYATITITSISVVCSIAYWYLHLRRKLTNVI